MVVPDRAHDLTCPSTESRLFETEVVTMPPLSLPSIKGRSVRRVVCGRRHQSLSTLIAAVLVALSSATSAPSAAVARQPNVVLIITDDKYVSNEQKLVTAGNSRHFSTNSSYF